MLYNAQRIRDPLHNLIEFQANEFENAMWGVIQTPPFQRLRRIKQLGFSDLIYPGATHSRFAHSIGVFHTARLLMNVIRNHLGENKFSDSHAKRALAAALVHDLGHGPFSHAFEDVGKRLNLKMAHHELVSNTLIRQSEVAKALNVLGSGFADDVASIINSKVPVNIYGAVVSSQFDADRLDYMRRDRLMTGTQHGMIDFEWLLANLEVGEVATGVDETSLGKVETFVLGSKAIYASEAYVLGLFQLYPTVYFHKATRGAEKIFTELLCRIIELARDNSTSNTGLPETHPLIKFAKNPDEIKNVLNLDDLVVWGALSQLVEAKDKLISSFASRLRDRNLYRSLNVLEEIMLCLPSSINADMKKDTMEKIRVSVEEKVKDWCAKNDGEIPRIISDEATRSPYRSIEESKVPLNQIHINTPTEGLVDLGKRSKVVGAIEPFRLYRLYLAKDDTEALEFIKHSIKQEVENDKQTKRPA